MLRGRRWAGTRRLASRSLCESCRTTRWRRDERLGREYRDHYGNDDGERADHQRYGTRMALNPSDKPPVGASGVATRHSTLRDLRLIGRNIGNLSYRTPGHQVPRGVEDLLGQIEIRTLRHHMH